MSSKSRAKETLVCRKYHMAKFVEFLKSSIGLPAEFCLMFLKGRVMSLLVTKVPQVGDGGP